MKELGRDYIDLFLLHEQESEHTLRGHWEALEYFLDRKNKGEIGAVGISTHTIAATKAALKIPEIAVVHPLINMRGLGIADGSREGMEQAIASLLHDRRGVYAMKALGGGHLIPERREAFQYALKLGVHSVAVGMQSEAEIDYNCALFEGLEPGEALERSVGAARRRLIVHDWCQGCGRCMERCRAGAITIENSRAVADQMKCTRCGYCAAVCPDFCIKVL
jgi:ferredoxin